MKIPTQQDLKNLRKGLRKRQVPEVFDDMWCSEPGIGGAKWTAAGDDYQVQWVIFENGIKSELNKSSWQALCSEPSLEMTRLKVGYVVAAIMDVQAQKVMNSIGHPIEAFNESKPYRKKAEDWRHWALVKAGHMLGL